MEQIQPNKDMVRTTDEILAQTRLILIQNQKIIDAICHPAIILTEEDCSKIKFPIRSAEPAEIIYKKDGMRET